MTAQTQVYEETALYTGVDTAVTLCGVTQWPRAGNLRSCV